MLSDHQNFNGTSADNWPSKFFFLSCPNLSASLSDYFLHSSKVFPNILFASTLLLYPVYPGKGALSYTYSFPYFYVIVLFTQGFVRFRTDSLNSSVLLTLN